ncbi:hypothetical protein [Cognatitamlana onchidii]|uniref:hypothetical protein n=1 Tax=Cognatitamlana onchidii TaxID=2562860 RepID=UPI001F160345|nr:hypothetical protein [Algibacter onchidii]
MADRNRSESKLIFGRVLPNIDAAIKNTCKLMDAQDYISGQASDFDRYFRDQLENGMYQVELYYESENNSEIVGDTTTVRQIKIGKSSKQKKFRIKRDANGEIIRDNSNTLKQYGLKIYQAQVTGIDWEAYTLIKDLTFKKMKSLKLNLKSNRQSANIIELRKKWRKENLKKPKNEHD